MKISLTTPDATVITELGTRAQQHRIGMNLTQAQLADAAGVSARTIERFEAGRSIQLDNLVGILRALRLSANLDQLLPTTSLRPLQLVGRTPSPRQRASPSRGVGESRPSGWVWGDER